MACTALALGDLDECLQPDRDWLDYDFVALATARIRPLRLGLLSSLYIHGCVPRIPSVRPQRLTSTIPIVFAQVGDPVAAGFVHSLARPGGSAKAGLPATIIASGALASKPPWSWRVRDRRHPSDIRSARCGHRSSPASGTYRGTPRCYDRSASKAKSARRLAVAAAHALQAATAPPSKVMNARRRMCRPQSGDRTLPPGVEMPRCAAQQIWRPMSGPASKALITASQHCRPLRPE